MAEIIQHEMDHLTGTFFIDRASQKLKKEVLELFGKWKTNQIISQTFKERQRAKDRA